MLAGSHAGRIANQLHNNLNNRRATVGIIKETQSTESQSKSLDDNIIQNPLNTNHENEYKENEIIINTKIELLKEKEKEQEKEKEKEKEEIYNPYYSAVLEIKKMTQYETPEDKIQCVVRTADIIKSTIDDYYENRRIDPIQITPDDLLSLFAYILTQANLHCLWAEVDLIDDFVVDNLRMDMPGYYIATLRAAMQLIVNDIEKLTQTSMKKRSSMKYISEL